ncbi:hypothetical protein HMN09_00724500 [Mycena chlorophos]|uniref:Uncharacterized protein n=1 Tax=Mycena chlorophos TaxID=658473 RepID=A0A8H6SWN8_MYCCL|nr:hypothetical protein HMN09_00724500 [Mycena chlorophos]
MRMREHGEQEDDGAEERAVKGDAFLRVIYPILSYPAQTTIALKVAADGLSIPHRLVAIYNANAPEISSLEGSGQPAPSAVQRQPWPGHPRQSISSCEATYAARYNPSSFNGAGERIVGQGRDECQLGEGGKLGNGGMNRRQPTHRLGGYAGCASLLGSEIRRV